MQGPNDRIRNISKQFTASPCNVTLQRLYLHDVSADNMTDMLGFLLCKLS